MRIAKIALLLLAGMTLQSCRIEMPSPLLLLSEYLPLYPEPSALYDFSLSRAVQLQGGFRDTLTSGDDLTTVHGQLMHEIIHEQMGVPEKNIVYKPDFLYDIIPNEYLEGLYRFTRWEENAALRRATRVVHLPFFLPFSFKEDPGLIAENSNVLFVLGAGNKYVFSEGGSDVYNPNYWGWNSDDPEKDRIYKQPYENILAAYDTGQVLAVTAGGNKVEVIVFSRVRDSI